MPSPSNFLNLNLLGKSPTLQKNPQIQKVEEEKVKHKTNWNYSESQYVTDLCQFVPSLVIQRLIQKSKLGVRQEKLPELQEMETVVIFADISGFTNLSEACAAKGVRGNEELAFCINRYMEGMV